MSTYLSNINILSWACYKTHLWNKFAFSILYYDEPMFVLLTAQQLRKQQTEPTYERTAKAKPGITTTGNKEQRDKETHNY